MKCDGRSDQLLTQPDSKSAHVKTEKKTGRNEWTRTKEIVEVSRLKTDMAFD